MNAPDSALVHLQQAAEWYAVLQSGVCTPEERASWQAWLAEREEHRQAWTHVENAGRLFSSLATEQHRDATGAALRHSQSEWRRKRRLLTRLVLLGVGGGAMWKYGAESELVLAMGAQYRTGIGEIRKTELPDGTHIWLNTASALNLDYTATARTVRLLAGEVLFDTAKDSVRPFTVVTSQGSMRALGTRFTVRRLDAHTLLSVYEGAVEITPASNGHPHVLHAGYQTRFSETDTGQTEPADKMHEAWSGGVLLANNVALGEFALELARYRRVYLNVSPDIAGLRVMGAYPANDFDKSLDLLADALSLKVRRILPWWITLEAH